MKDTMARLIPAVLLIAATAVLPRCREAPSVPSPPSDIYVIVIDAAAAGYLGCYGDPHGTSPCIDELAADSVVFENNYSQSATTNTSTASLITGTRLPTHRKVKSVLSSEFKTLAELLGEKGYVTAAVIANPKAAGAGLARGYDRLVKVWDLPHLWDTREKRKNWSGILPLPDDVNRQFIEILPELDSGPSFVYLHYLQPHIPYDPPEEYLELFHPVENLTPWKELEERMKEAEQAGVADPQLIAEVEARYRANIRYVDDAVGELIRRLKEEGRYDRSLIVFTSDHGDAFFGHRRFGHDTHVFDDMVRVPLLVKLPADYEVAPSRIDALVEAIDVTATLLEASGVPLPEQLEGRSLLPLILNGQADPDGEVVVSTRLLDRHAIRVGRFKYIMNRDGEAELYDLDNDPAEQNNLAGERPGLAASLKKRMESLVDVHATWDAGSGRQAAPDVDTRELMKALGYTGDDDE